uniref:Uncharacterized protein n=1 Tax=Xenopus tropicalis TaxID=8364 RepID=A0A1B8XYD9_XENTR
MIYSAIKCAADVLGMLLGMEISKLLSKEPHSADPWVCADRESVDKNATPRQSDVEKSLLKIQGGIGRYRGQRGGGAGRGWME